MSHNQKASDLLAKVMAAKKSVQVNPELCGSDKQTTENHKAVTITTDGAEIWDALLKTISETVNNGGGKYSGKVYSPDRGKTYKSKLVLSGKTLKVSGCVFGICRGQTWQRLK